MASDNVIGSFSEKAILTVRRRWFISFLCLFFLSVAGCKTGLSEAGFEEILLPTGAYRLEEVLVNEQLLLTVGAKEGGWNDVNPQYMVAEEGGLSSLSLPDDPSCLTGTAYQHPRMLPDGRLGFVKYCVKSLEVPVGERGESTLVAISLQTGEVEQIMALPLYDQRPFGNFTWNPTMSQGVAGLNGLAATLYWISPEGPEPMDIFVGEGAESWGLAEALTDFWDPGLPVEDWPSVGIATKPAWSPDGETIAFLASPTATELTGQARIGVPYNLYFMSPNALEPEIVLENIYNPILVRWSPNGKALLIDSCLGPLRRCGLWTYRPDTYELRLVASGKQFGGAGWISNSEIAASYCADQDELGCSHYLLRLYAVSHINDE